MGEEEDAAAAEGAEVAEGVPTAVVEAARVEWEEEDVEVATTGLRCRVEAIVVGAAIAEVEEADGPHRGALGTVQVAWPRIETRPEETLTGLRPPRKFNLVRMAPGELFLRLHKEEGVEEEGVEPPGPATKGFPMLVEERVLVNSRGEVRVLVNSRGEVKAPRVAGSKVPRAVRFPTECRVVN